MAMTPEAAAVLARLQAEDQAQRDAGLPSAQRTRNVDRATARFLSLVARSIAARAILEIGSSNGLSTIWLALAAREADGTVIGTELLPERAAEANANLAEAGLGDVARVIEGDALGTVGTLDGPFDLVFIDAEKDDYIAHFEAAIGLLRPGGVTLADNVVSHDLSAYQAMLRARDDVETVTLPLDRGIEYTVKVGARRAPLRFMRAACRLPRHNSPLRTMSARMSPLALARASSPVMRPAMASAR